MDYLEVTIETASAGIEAVASALTAGGFDSLVVEDQAEYENFLEDNRAYWDYIDEEFQQELQGLSRIKLYLEVDGTEEKQLQKLENMDEDKVEEIATKRANGDSTPKLTAGSTNASNIIANSTKRLMRWNVSRLMNAMKSGTRNVSTSDDFNT